MWDGHPVLDRHLLYDATTPQQVGIEELRTESVPTSFTCPYCGVEIPIPITELHKCFGTLIPGRIARLPNDTWVLVLRADKDTVTYFSFRSVVILTEPTDEFLEREET